MFLRRVDWVMPLLFWGAACAWLLPARRDVVREAMDRESKTCPHGGMPEYPAGLFDPSSVAKVEPLTSTVRTSRSGQEARLVGARIWVRPFPTVSADGLESLLNCHSARRALSRANEPEILNDPYWVPGRSIDLSVQLEGGAPCIEVRGSDFETAKKILDRASAFARSAQ